MTRLPKGHRSCLDPAFRYTPAASTDVAATFARLRREAAMRRPTPGISVWELTPIEIRLFDTRAGR